MRQHQDRKQRECRTHSRDRRRLTTSFPPTGNFRRHRVGLLVPEEQGELEEGLLHLPSGLVREVEGQRGTHLRVRMRGSRKQGGCRRCCLSVAVLSLSSSLRSEIWMLLCMDNKPYFLKYYCQLQYIRFSSCDDDDDDDDDCDDGDSVVYKINHFIVVVVFTSVAHAWMLLLYISVAHAWMCYYVINYYMFICC